MGVLVPSETTYIGLLNILFKALKLRLENHTIGIRYIVDLGISLVKLLDNLDVKFYLELKNNEVDMTKFPLCLDLVEKGNRHDSRR